MQKNLTNSLALHIKYSFMEKEKGKFDLLKK